MPAAPTTGLSPAQRQTLLAEWQSRIYARIARARPRYSGTGRVMLNVSITRGGQLLGVSVARSSGDPALDQAAMAAIRRIGRLPAAPPGIDEASIAFGAPMTFQ